jgi:hypothetical protein
METVNYNNNDYVCVDYIYNNAPIYSKTCRNGRDLIKKKEIKDFIYFRLKDGKWTLSDGKSMKCDKIFIKKDFINSIPELNKTLDKVTDDTPHGRGVEEAPFILELEDNEMFKDVDGKPLNIEVRGERKSDKCFFKVKDVSEAFDMLRLYDTIIDKNSKYLINKHYKYFNCQKPQDMGKKQLKKELYLTYEGMLRVLFVSENDKTTPFVKWATETLFTVQMGEEEDKDSLAASLLGTKYKVIKQVFRCSSKTTPCIYLLLLKEEGDKLICKYGFTKDLVRRMREHKSFFTKEFGKEPTLLYYGVIDIMYMSEAESNLSCYFKNYKYNYNNMDELVIIDKSEMNQTKMIYQSMENKYIGRYEEMKNQINELKLEIVNLTKNLEIQQEKHNMELYKKDMEIKSLKASHINELQQKDIDILKKEVELLRIFSKK